MEKSKITRINLTGPNQIEDVKGLFKFYALIDPIDKSVVYIGATKTTVHDRIRKHMTVPLRCINGWVERIKKESMPPMFEILGTCGLDENWELCEQELIHFYKSYYNTVLNVSQGGFGPNGVGITEERRLFLRNLKSMPVFSKSLETGLIKEYPSFDVAAKYLGIKSSSQISRSIKFGRSAKGHIFSKDPYSFYQSHASQQHMKKVIATSITGEEFEFNSTHDAARSLKMNQRAVWDAANGVLKQAKGYKFRYKN